jgi:hypothetical protein
MANLRNTIKVIEKESELFGLPASDFMVLVFFIIFWIILPMFLEVIKIKCGLLFYLFFITLTIVFYRVLKRFSKKGNNLIYSYISLKVIQPKRIEPAVVTFELKPIEDKKKIEKSEG